MTATALPELRKVRGPVLGLPHLVQLRRDPIGHNVFLHEAYGDVVRLNVFGTTMYLSHGPEMAEKVLVKQGPRLRERARVVALHRPVLPARDHAAGLR